MIQERHNYNRRVKKIDNVAMLIKREMNEPHKHNYDDIYIGIELLNQGPEDRPSESSALIYRKCKCGVVAQFKGTIDKLRNAIVKEEFIKHIDPGEIMKVDKFNKEVL